MRFWIVVGGSVLVLAAAIWPVGKKTEPPTTPPVTVNAPPPAAQTPEPPKVPEVIDLSRAYDPVREPDEPITPATFIEVPTQVERLDLMPREVTVQNGLMDFVPEWHRLWMNNQPSVLAGDRLTGVVSQIDVMPRVVPPRFVIEQTNGHLLHYVEVADGAVVRVPHSDSPADEHFTHPIQRAAFTVPLIPVERLTVEPRPNDIQINRGK